MCDRLLLVVFVMINLIKQWYISKQYKNKSSCLNNEAMENHMRVNRCTTCLAVRIIEHYESIEN